MARTKKSLALHLQMLRVFMSAHTKAKSMCVSSIYEAHILARGTDGLLTKTFRYYLPGSVLPDHYGMFEDIYITLLTPQQIKYYVEECDKYGIEG